MTRFDFASLRDASLRMTAALAIAFTAACGGGGLPVGSVVNSGGGGNGDPTPLVNVKVTVTIPAQSKSKGIRPNYVSVNTKSLVIALSSVDGKGVTGVNPTIIDTTPGSHGCKPHGGETVCTANASGSPGQDVFAVTTYAHTNATGSVLSLGTVSARIGKSGSGVQISNQLSLSLSGVIASINLAVSPKSAKLGKPANAAVTLNAFDASGAQIVGPSAYAAAISLAIQGDTSKAFALHVGAKSGTSFTIEKPTSNITLTYNGSKQASSITLAATVNGEGSIAASVPFKLHGHSGPPPVGTIYVLNLGKKTGQGAVVTEYSGSASGNAAPENTLNLDPKLYARSIAVDASGNLYVGYLDGLPGYNTGTGQPDAGNEVAIYAPGATGNDAPTATINSDPTPSIISNLYPIYIAIDPSGRLVSYGATDVDQNNGTGAGGVLTYPAGASGAVPPEYAFNFASPFLKYNNGAPTGLAIDPNNNFYVNGKLVAVFNPEYGLYVALAQDIGNPKAPDSRSIPWNGTSNLSPGFVTNVALDNGGEIYIGASLTGGGSGSGNTCQAYVNAYSSGPSGGSQGDSPLRTLTLSGVTLHFASQSCQSSALFAYFPTIQMNDTSLFVADVGHNAVDLFDGTAGGTVKPSLQITGSATLLDEPVALALSSLSGQAKARPAHPR
ncbi:MAG TPA: hypothetical protein VHT92_04170 [Candidatus Cybelea sp.]|jgi:hypothetical protein|nr:hypothetical protein [Candidatus Cybelea sp.]